MCFKWIEYQGAQILYQDFSGGGMLNAAKYKEEFAALEDMILAQPPQSVRVLTNFNASVFSKDLLEVMVAHSRLTRPHIKKFAALGVTGPKRIMAGMVERLSGQPMALFEDEQQAQEWLTES